MLNWPDVEEARHLEKIKPVWWKSLQVLQTKKKQALKKNVVLQQEKITGKVQSLSLRAYATREKTTIARIRGNIQETEIHKDFQF